MTVLGMPEQEELGGSGHPHELILADRFEGGGEIRPRLDLDKDQKLPAPDHEIDLTNRGAKPAGKQTEPAQAEAPGCDILGHPPPGVVSPSFPLPHRGVNSL